MPAVAKSVAIRLGVEGAAEIRTSFRDVQASGVSSFQAIGAAAGQAGERITTSARASARTFQTALAEQEKQATALRQAIDPLGAAQANFNKQVADLNRLQTYGKVTAQERAAGEALLRKELDETTAAINRRNAAQRGQGGLSQSGKVNLGYQIQDIGVSLAGGQNPLMVLAQQGSQISGILAAEGIAISGAMIAVGAAVAGVIGTVGLLAVTYFKADAAEKQFEISAAGLGKALGLTSSQMENVAEQAAKVGDISVSSARGFELAYAAAGVRATDVMSAAIEVSHDLAIALGVKDADAAKELAKALADPKAGVDTLNKALGYLDDGTVQYIKSLAEQNDKTDAQRIMIERLIPAMDRARDHLSGWARLWHDVGVQGSDALNHLGRALDPTDEEKLADLQKQKSHSWSWQDTSAFDTPIKRLQDKIAADAARTVANAARARANEDAANARSIIDGALAQESKIRELTDKRAALLPYTKANVPGAASMEESKKAYAELGREIEEAKKKIRERGGKPDTTDYEALRSTLALQNEMDVARASGDKLHIQALDDEIYRRKEIAALIDGNIKGPAVGILADMQLSAVQNARAANDFSDYQAAWRELKDHEANPHPLEDPTVKAARERLTKGFKEDTEGKELAKTLEAGRKAADRLEQQFHDAMENGMVSGIRAAEKGGRSFAEFLGNAVASRLEKAMAAALTDKAMAGAGQGGFAGLLAAGASFLFGGPGGSFDVGTPYAPGGRSKVHKDEIIDLPQGARVHPAAQSRQMDDAGGASTNHFTYAPVYQVQGYGQDIEALKAQMAEDRAQFAANVAVAVNDGVSRRWIAAA